MATTMRGFGAQNVMLMRNDSTPGSDSLVAMLASCTPMGLQGELVAEMAAVGTENLTS
jgi:hypothetical protein